MRPVGDASHQAMLHGIEVDVVDAVPQVTLVADEALPVAALPDAAFAFRDPGCRPALIAIQATRKFALDPVPALGKAEIPFRQRPDAMQMIGKDHVHRHCIRSPRVHDAKRDRQRIDPIHQPRSVPVGDGQREDIRPARDEKTSIIRHAASSPTDIPPHIGVRPRRPVGKPRGRRVGPWPTITTRPGRWQTSAHAPDAVEHLIAEGVGWAPGPPSRHIRGDDKHRSGTHVTRRGRTFHCRDGVPGAHPTLSDRASMGRP